MIKTIKTVALLAVGYTIGETITTWRMQPEPMPFNDFLKRYVGTCKLAFVDARAITVDVLNGETTTKDGLNAVMFNSYPL